MPLVARCISRLIVFPDKKMERKMLSLTEKSLIDLCTYISLLSQDWFAELHCQLHCTEPIINTFYDPFCFLLLPSNHLPSSPNRCFNLILPQRVKNLSKYKTNEIHESFSGLIFANIEFGILCYLQCLNLYQHGDWTTTESLKG